MGTAQCHWIQQEHLMVCGQELAGGICQLWGPGIQATQILIHQTIYHVFA